MNTELTYILWLMMAYFLGSTLIGELICRYKGVDIRKLGTGNPGAANIWREVGRKYGLSVFLFDIMKGVGATLPLRLLGAELEWIAGSMLCMLLGQFFPIFFKFKGNTGMAALFGASAGVVPWGVAIAAPIAVIKFAITKNVGWAGGIFFGVSCIAGGIIYRSDLEWLGVLYLMVGCILVFVKQHIQYRSHSNKSS